VATEICSKCVLKVPFPGLSFDSEGCCCYCRKAERKTKASQSRQQLKSKFNKLIEARGSRGNYDAVAAFSGGKDSTYTLKLLSQKFGLTVLAVTFDHGFISPRTIENIKVITKALQVDHIMVRPAQGPLYEIFRKSTGEGCYPLKSLTRASSICLTCMHLVKSYMIKTAIEMAVPLVVYGWSPGQAPVMASIFKTNAAILARMSKAQSKILSDMQNGKLKHFFVNSNHFNSGRCPIIVHPLAFLDYDEACIYNEIKTLGWQSPADTDANSTNCLLNTYANCRHMQQYGFHPYSLEISNMVRDGYLSREDGLNKLSQPPDWEIVRYVDQKLFAGG
jgi:tRNA(Ile)-lysidine synthase TilS/MesJ